MDFVCGQCGASMSGLKSDDSNYEVGTGYPGHDKYRLGMANSGDLWLVKHLDGLKISEGVLSCVCAKGYYGVGVIIGDLRELVCVLEENSKPINLNLTRQTVFNTA